jgi:multicomponent Na+:H+ antiporter subunit F
VLTDLVTLGIQPLLGLAALLCAWRTLRGPTLADRVVGLEMLTALAIGIAACSAVAARQPALVDVSLVLALVAFLGTLAFAAVMRSDR